MNYSKLHPNFFQRGGYSPVQFSSSQFIPTYAGAPIAEAKANAEQIAGIYHQNIADLTKIDMMNANRKIIPSDADKAENEKINTRLAEQFKNITAKGDMENQTLQVNALLREYMNDPAVKALTESRANADREKAFQEEARSKGATIVLDNPAEGHQTVTYDEKGRPQYNVYQGTGQIKLDWQGRKAKIADELKPDASPMEIKSVSQDIVGYIATGKWEGISGGVDKNGKPIGKVGRQLDNLMTAYQQTAEYTQEKAVDMRELQQQGLSPEEASVEADKLARQRMFAEGMLRTYSKTDKDYVMDWLMKMKEEDKKAKEPTSHLGLASGMNVKSVLGTLPSTIATITSPTGGGPMFDENGKVISVGSHNVIDPVSGAIIQEATELKPWERGTIPQREAYEGMARKVVQASYPGDKLGEIYKNNKTAKDQQQAEKEFLYGDEVAGKMKKIVKAVEEVTGSPKINKFNSKVMNAITAEIVGGLTNRKILVDGKAINPINNPELFEALADPTSKLTVYGDTADVNPYGDLGGDPAFYNSYMASYIDPKTKVAKEAIIAKDIGEYTPYSVDPQLSQEWTDLLKTPYTPKTITAGDNTAEVESRVNENGAVTFWLVSLNGKPINRQDAQLPSYRGLKQAISELK